MSKIGEGMVEDYEGLFQAAAFGMAGGGNMRVAVDLLRTENGRKQRQREFRGGKPTGSESLGVGYRRCDRYSKIRHGGQTWSLVDPSLAVEDNGAWKTGSASSSAIPVLQGAGVIDRIFFVNEELGFLCGYSGAEVNTARICRTRDGGKTADVQRLPLPASDADISARVLIPYHRDRTIYLPVRINSEPSGTKILVFSSSDLGDTWVYEEAMGDSADAV